MGNSNPGYAGRYPFSAPCSRGKTEHKYRITLSCPLCERSEEILTVRPCMSIFSSSFLRQVGCKECGNYILMYFRCYRGGRDTDRKGLAAFKTLRIIVENEDD